MILANQGEKHVYEIGRRLLPGLAKPIIVFRGLRKDMPAEAMRAVLREPQGKSRKKP